MLQGMLSILSELDVDRGRVDLCTTPPNRHSPIESELGKGSVIKLRHPCTTTENLAVLHRLHGPKGDLSGWRLVTSAGGAL